MGRYAVITGANQGLGRKIAEEYVRAGAHICICARGEELLRKAQEEFRKLAGDGQQVLAEKLDVSDEREVGQFFNNLFGNFPRLDILVNNAGIYGPKGTIEEADWEEWKRTIEINLYGVIYTCKAVLPHFRKNRYGKIINLSGGGATNPLPRLSAYAASKAAVARFSETLAEEVKEYRIDVNLIAPGALKTRMMKEVIDAGPEKVGEEFYKRMTELWEKGGTPLEKGAELAVFLGSSFSDGITGRLISAVWDPWEEFPDHIEDILSTDIYTLRRIVPKDRGFTWGK